MPSGCAVPPKPIAARIRNMIEKRREKSHQPLIPALKKGNARMRVNTTALLAECHREAPVTMLVLYKRLPT